jgi:hypothetical protein
MPSFAGVVAMAVAPNATGLPVSAGIVAACSDCGPAVVPRVQLATLAMPAELLLTVTDCADVVPSDTVAPASTVEKVTATPATAFPYWSFTATAGGVATAAPGAALWPAPATALTALAGPAAICTLLDVADS